MRTDQLLKTALGLLFCCAIMMAISDDAAAQTANDTSKTSPQPLRQGGGFFTGGNATVKRIESP